MGRGGLRDEAGEMSMRWVGRNLRMPVQSLDCILRTMEGHLKSFS